MSTGEQTISANARRPADDAGRRREAEPKRKLDLDVQISDVGPCKKHIKVTIPRADVEKQFKESVGEMAKEAVVPGSGPAAPRSSSRSGSARRSPARSSRPC